MTKNSKIIVIASAIVAGIGIIYVGIRYFTLFNAYNTNVTEEAANNMIDNATINITDDALIPDETTDNANAQKGTEFNEESFTQCPEGMTWDYEVQMCVKLQ
jgi:hypothetical protein